MIGKATIKLSEKHLTPEGQILFVALSDRMNDWTYTKGDQKKLAIDQLDLKFKQLLADNSVVNVRTRGSYVKIKICPLEGNSVYSPMSIQEVADFFQVSIKTISRRLADGKPLMHQNSSFYVKRVEKSTSKEVLR